MDTSLQEVSDDIGPLLLTDLPEPEAWLLIEHSCAVFAGGTGQRHLQGEERQRASCHTYCVYLVHPMV